MPNSKRLLVIIFSLVIIALIITMFFLFRQNENPLDNPAKNSLNNLENKNFLNKSEQKNVLIETKGVSPIENLDKAVQEKNPELCREISGNGANYCIGNVAMAADNPEICKKIEDPLFFTKCNELFNLKKITDGHDAKKCLELTDAELRQSCNIIFFRRHEDIKSCLGLNGEMRRDCQDFIHDREAYEKDDDKLCSLIANPPRKKDCLEKLRLKPKDADKDGLSDDEEIFFGTDPKKADTDGDGLSDFDEIKKYQTNPKIKDTDKDGYPDGEEVKMGYDPLSN